MQTRACSPTHSKWMEKKARSGSSAIGRRLIASQQRRSAGATVRCSSMTRLTTHNSNNRTQNALIYLLTTPTNREATTTARKTVTGLERAHLELGGGWLRDERSRRRKHAPWGRAQRAQALVRLLPRRGKQRREGTPLTTLSLCRSCTAAGGARLSEEQQIGGTGARVELGCRDVGEAGEQGIFRRRTNAGGTPAWAGVVASGWRDWLD